MLPQHHRKGVFSRVHTLEYPGTEPRRFGHSRVCIRVPNLDGLVILGYVSGYLTWLFRSYSGMHPGTKFGCFGHTRVCIGVPNLVALVLLGHVPGDQTWLFWSYSGVYPGTKLFSLVILGNVPSYLCTQLPAGGVYRVDTLRNTLFLQERH